MHYLVLFSALSSPLPVFSHGPPPLLLHVQIYEYRNGHQEVESPFQGRLQWNGSKDLQDVSITVLNVTLNDSGLYTCNVSREFEFEAHRPFVKTTRLIPLRVTEEGKARAQALLGEGRQWVSTQMSPLKNANPHVFGVVRSKVATTGMSSWSGQLPASCPRACLFLCLSSKQIGLEMIMQESLPGPWTCTLREKGQPP